MNINSVKGAIYIGDVVENPKAYGGNKPVLYQKSLKIDYSDNLPQGLATRHLSIVYFICVDDIIYKIGQTSGKTGIDGCMSFYCKAGQDDPGQNRFTINALMREEMQQGKKISIYIQYMDPVQVSVPGLSREHIYSVPLSAKCLEEACLTEYRESHNAPPPWNFQEAGTPVPTYINEQFASYRAMRAMERA